MSGQLSVTQDQIASREPTFPFGKQDQPHLQRLRNDIISDVRPKEGPGEVLRKYSLPSLPSNQSQVLGSQLKISESSFSSPVGF